MPIVNPVHSPQESTLRFEPRAISGLRPISEFHLGHYFGAAQQIVDQQNRHPGETYCLIADLHATPSWRGRSDMMRTTLETTAALLAVGVNPSKTSLFLQSSVHGLAEMTWLLACMTPASLLLRNPVLCPQISGTLNMGSLLYPILMAADVLSLKATKILAGRDQAMNVRRVRQIARAANRHMGFQIFPVPEPIQSQTVPGTDGSKMDHARNNHIPLFSTFRQLRQRVQQIRTDSRGVSDPKDASACTVFRLYSMVATSAQVEELGGRYSTGSIGYEEAKRLLAIAIAERFAEATDSFAAWQKRPADLHDLLRQGGRTASERAAETIAILREKFGFGS
jgi:tryptophanyl-tRNA synthetase